MPVSFIEMNNITSWVQQAKEVTKKITDMMYVPAEDNVERENSLDNAVAENICVGTKTEEKASNLKEVENKENISLNSTVKLESRSCDERSVAEQNRSKLETNATATIETAKKYANSFFTLAKEATTKAAITAEETAKKLQNVVAEKTIIGNLDKEQAKFKDEVNANKLTACELPWSDLPDQWVAKKHILSLSLDARNFTRDPPSETNYDFKQMQSMAAALLEEDPNLRKIRFKLVPKKLSEERFWGNYFYRVSLVRQAALGVNCSHVAEAPVFSKAADADRNIKSFAFEEAKAGEKIKISEDNEILETSAKEQKETEDGDGETEKKMLREIRENIASVAQERTEEDLERDLINSLNDYELVNDQIDKTDEQWDEEICELLNSA